MAVLILATPRNAAIAGGGPENVLLVVNATSEDSKQIANHYIEMRQIPEVNVLYLDWKGSRWITGGKTFRNRILTPVLKAIEERRLGAQIDYVAYSSDFPCRINLQDLFPEAKFELPFNPISSLTGATYLAPFVVAKNPAIVMPDVNWYVPGPIGQNVLSCEKLADVASRGFRSVYMWDKEGKRTKNAAAGQRYMLSTVLGVTYGRGNTVPEILSYLQLAKSADGTRPRGTVYFMQNGNVRSRTRDKCFESVAAQIRRLGVRATVLRGTIPHDAKDIIGLMAGVARFDWPGSGNEILPGAVCEHLTSAGGVLKTSGSQTPLSIFLRYGAAGSSGTVTEPRAIQAKFPLPSLHLHYARGCSLAESFYQSVSGPYQLLIVGDPLCQPWARFPSVAIKSIEQGQKVSGELPISTAGTASIAAYDLFVDGRLAARSRPGQTINLNTEKLADGYHELRLVGAASNAIETQGRSIVPIIVDNHGAKLKLEVVPQPAVGHAGELSISVSQPGATAITIRQNNREVASVEGDKGEVKIAASTLGRGPTTLQAFSEGPEKAVSLPVRLQVK